MSSSEVSSIVFDCGVVLGYGTTADDQLSPTSRNRMDVGIRLCSERKIQRLILAEGKDKHRTLSGAEVMRRYALSKGIPGGSLVLEDKGTATASQAYYTKVSHLLPNRWISIVVISSALHLPRVRFLFNKFLGSTIEYPFILSYEAEDSGLYDKRWDEWRYMRLCQVLSLRLDDGDHEGLKRRFSRFHMFER
jgi:uncharacterized SAM-binding protein YcdF (DUF218 family)